MFGRPKIMPFSVGDKNFYSKMGFEFKIKQNMEKSNRGKAKPKTQEPHKPAR